MAVELAETKRQIFEYVESRMAFIAPNLSAIIGKGQRDKQSEVSCYIAEYLIALHYRDISDRGVFRGGGLAPGGKNKFEGGKEKGATP